MLSIEAWTTGEERTSAKPPSLDPTSSEVHNIPFRNVTLLVEERPLYSNTGILALVSPVFRSMFSTAFREADMAEIPLPGKAFDDMQALLLTVQLCQPSESGICADNVVRLLALAKEYQMDYLWDKCLVYLKDDVTRDNVLSYFCQVKRHRLEELDYIFFAETLRCYREFAELEKDKDFNSIDQCTQEGLKIALQVTKDATSQEVDRVRQKYDDDISRLRFEMTKLRRERMALIFQQNQGGLVNVEGWASGGLVGGVGGADVAGGAARNIDTGGDHSYSHGGTAVHPQAPLQIFDDLSI